MQTIEIIAAIIALVYIYLEYKASKWLWPVGSDYAHPIHLDILSE